MTKRLIVISGALFALTAAGLPQSGAGVPQDAAGASRQDGTRGVSALDAITVRKASFDMSAITFHSMEDAAKAGTEAKDLGFAAASLARWAKALARMFPPGTGKGDTSAATQALPAIWQDRAGFEHAAAYYADVTARLAALAGANDTAGFKKQLEVVDQACGACHSTYKQAMAGHGPHAK